MSEISTVYYAIDSINPSKYNPRKISEKNMKGLIASIEENGFVIPLVVNIRDKKNVLVGGHQRLKAAQILKIEKVPVIEVDLDEVREAALNLALNNKHIEGEFDRDLIGDVLDLIKSKDKDLFEKLNFDLLEEEYLPVMPTFNEDDEDDEEEIKQYKYVLEVQFPSEVEMTSVYNDMLFRGYIAKVKK